MNLPMHWQPTSINSSVQIIPVNHRGGSREGKQVLDISLQQTLLL